MIFGSRLYQQSTPFSSAYAADRQAVVVWSTHYETMYFITNINIISVRLVKLKLLPRDDFNAGLHLAERNAYVEAGIKAIASLGFDGCQQCRKSLPA